MRGSETSRGILHDLLVLATPLCLKECPYHFSCHERVKATPQANSKWSTIFAYIMRHLLIRSSNCPFTFNTTFVEEFAVYACS